VQWGKFLMDINMDYNTVDDMLAIQRRFLDDALEACMLKDRKARMALTVLMDTCILFTTQLDYFHDATKLKVHDPSRRRLVAIDSSPPTAELCRERLELAQELREQRRDIQSSRLEQGATAASYRSMVNRFSEAFDRRLKDFVATLSTQHVSLYTRLNFNGFLSDSGGAPLNDDI
jgi:Gamma tubulin complex component C-terminal